MAHDIEHSPFIVLDNEIPRLCHSAGERAGQREDCSLDSWVSEATDCFCQRTWDSASGGNMFGRAAEAGATPQNPLKVFIWGGGPED